MASLAVLTVCYQAGQPDIFASDSRGFGLTSPAGWFADPWVSSGAGMCVNILVMTGIIIINRTFNLLRGLPRGGLLWASLFMLMQAGVPFGGRFSGGSLLSLVAIISIGLLYSVYQQPGLTRRVLLVFVLLGAGSLVQYGFIPYLAVMTIGCVQMRVMSLRTLIAIVAGTLVPLWVLWCFGVVSPENFSLPLFQNIFTPGTLMAALPVAVATLLSMMAGCGAGLADMLQVYARNARTRAFFGLIASTGIMTGVLSVIDFGNIEFYLPLLNITTAYFVTQLYSFRPRGAMGAGTVAIVMLTVLFLALYIWRIIDTFVL